MRPVISIRLWGTVHEYFGDGGWRGPFAATLETLTPHDTPDIPDWPRQVAEAIRDELGAEIIYTQARENVPGRVY